MVEETCSLIRAVRAHILPVVGADDLARQVLSLECAAHHHADPVRASYIVTALLTLCVDFYQPHDPGVALPLIMRQRLPENQGLAIAVNFEILQLIPRISLGVLPLM